MYLPQNICFEKQVDILQECHLGNADLNKLFTSPDQESNKNISTERDVSEIELIKDIQEPGKCSLFSYWLQQLFYYIFLSIN